MKKVFMVVSLLALFASSTQAQAASSIGDFLEYESAKSYFNCSYKTKKASKKCLVIKSNVNSSVHPRTKEFYGSNYNLPLLTIKWPDGDTSRYVIMDSWDMINIADNKAYQARDWDQDIGFTKGLFIDNSGRDHVRLW